MAYYYVILGFILLLGGAEFLVRGSVALAERLNVSPLVIGLTVVAFGTSAPELVVSVGAALNGASGLSVGNIVGSNIANILLILGATSIIRPVTCNREDFFRDFATLYIVTAIFTTIALTGTFLQWHGFMMILMLLIFIYYSYKR